MGGRGAQHHARPGALRGLLLAAALLLAGACTGSFEDFERAVALAEEKGTVRVEDTTVIRPTDGAEEQVRVFVAGAVDLRADAAAFTLTMELTPPPEEPAPVPCRMVLDGETTYLADASGEGWLRAELAPPEGPDDPLATDPRAAFELLRAVFGDVEGVKRDEEVRGVATTHWRVFVDLDRLLELEGEEPTERGFFASLSTRKLPVDVWIDADGLPRRVAFTVPEPAPGGSVEIDSTTEIFDYGAPVEIEVPPPAEVREEANPGLAILRCMGAPVG